MMRGRLRCVVFAAAVLRCNEGTWSSEGETSREEGIAKEDEAVDEEVRRVRIHFCESTEVVCD